MKLAAAELTQDLLLKAQDFYCEYPYIRTYLSDSLRAFEDGKIGETKTTLIIDEYEDKIAAYFSIKCSSLRVEEQEEQEEQGTKISIYPTIEVVMFAVDSNYRGKDVGKQTFAYAISHINSIRSLVGVRAITLFSVPDAVSFYRDKFFFKELSEGMDMYTHPSCGGCVPMFLALPKIE